MDSSVTPALQLIRKALRAKRWRAWKKSATIPRRRVEVAIDSRGSAAFEQILDICEAVSIPYFTGGAESPAVRRLHLRLEDAELFTRSLLAAFRGSDLRVYPKRIGKESEPLKAISRIGRKGESFTLFIQEHLDTTVTPVLDFRSAVEIDFWKPVLSYTLEPLCETSRENRHFSRVRLSTLDRLLESRQDIDELGHRDLYTPQFEVDVVYTWVDDSDPEWAAQYDFYARKAGRTASAGARAHHRERFKNRDELRYSLRSIEQFAPFVRRIFIVTADQKPEWLNLQHPRLTLVSHKDIYRDSSVLPTFNSSGIETQLHHIDGLADHFLYFNDDFFLGQLCSIDDFFLPNGAIKFFPSDQRAHEFDIDESREEYIIADKNATELFAQDFGWAGRLLMIHSPYAASRSLLYEMERRYQEAFDTCAVNRFRSSRDLRPIAFMQYHFGFASGRAVPGTIPNRYLALWKPIIEEQLANVRKWRKHKTFCINDVGLQPEREQAVNAAVAEFLRNYFPVPSSFEKVDAAMQASVADSDERSSALGIPEPASITT